MKIQLSVTVAVLLLGHAGGAAAQRAPSDPVVADYIEGVLEMMTPKGGWDFLEFGSELSTADTVRLSDDGVADWNLRSLLKSAGTAYAPT